MNYCKGRRSTVSTAKSVALRVYRIGKGIGAYTCRDTHKHVCMLCLQNSNIYWTANWHAYRSKDKSRNIWNYLFANGLFSINPKDNDNAVIRSQPFITVQSMLLLEKVEMQIWKFIEICLADFEFYPLLNEPKYIHVSIFTYTYVICFPWKLLK